MAKNREDIIEVIDDLKSVNAQNNQTFKLLLEEINRKLEDIGDGKEFVIIRNTISDFKKSVSGRFNEIASSLDEIQKKSADNNPEDLLTLLDEKIKSAFNSFDNNLNSITDNLSAMYDKFKLETGENFAFLKDDLIKLSQTLSVINLEVKETNKELQNSNEHLISSVLQDTNKFKEDLELKADSLSNLINESFADIKSELKSDNNTKIKNDLEKYFKQYCSKITEITDIIVNLKNNISTISNDYSKYLTDFNDGLNSLKNDFQVNYSDIQDEIKAEFLQKFENFQKFITANFDNYGQNLESAIDNLRSELNSFIETISDKFEEINNLIKENETALSKYGDFLNELSVKLDIIAQTDYSDDLEEIATQNAETQELIKVLHTKVDELLTGVPSEDENIKHINEHLIGLETSAEIVVNTLKSSKNEEILSLNQEIKELIKSVDESIKNFEIPDPLPEITAVIEENAEKYKAPNPIPEIAELIEKSAEKHKAPNPLPEIASLIEKTENRLNFIIEEAKETNEENFENINEGLKIQKNLLDELNAKLDIFASSNENELLEDELLEIKEILLAQEKTLENTETGLTEKAANNFKDIIAKIDSVTQTISEHESNAEKIKENIIETIVSVFNNTDFTEESEDIKGFVEEKTDELNKQLHDVKSQLKSIKESEITDYAYTLSDVEQDIATLRGAIKDVTSSTPVAEINQISRNIHNLTSSIDAISKNLTPAEIFQLKHGILKLNDDILSISSRTNKLLINSDEASKTISDGVEAFSHIAYNLEERIKEFSNRELVVQIADKLERILVLSENSATADATVQKVLMFLGEWVDAVSETFTDIDNKTDEISKITDSLTELRKIIPEKTEIFETLEEHFEEQQSRIDRLEAKLNKLTETVETNNITPILQKLEKLENVVNTMNNSVEKLTSYVE